MTTVRHKLNADEGVTVRIGSKGGVKIWVRARGDRAPLQVAFECQKAMPKGGPHQAAILDAVVGESLDRNPRTYREELSWPGS